MLEYFCIKFVAACGKNEEFENIFCSISKYWRQTFIDGRIIYAKAANNQSWILQKSHWLRSSKINGESTFTIKNRTSEYSNNLKN